MTDEEKRLQEELLRKIEEVYNQEDQQQSAGQQQEEAFWDMVQKLRRERVAAARQAAQHQQEIYETPRRHYAVIAAVDNTGGFSKDGKMPWSYAEDFKWFKGRTKGHVCTMGRLTYEDIISRNNDGDPEAPVVVLPDRQNFVLSRSVDTLPGATVVKSLIEIENHLEEKDAGKTVFAIGGTRVFNEGLALAQTVYLSIIDNDYKCDKHFPVEYLQEHFVKHRMYKHENTPDLRWTVWKRNQ
jgi:dihydrofolate reductase